MATKIRPASDQLRAAVQLASRAPSIHNTQPWRWALRPDGLDLYADRFRQLAVADPDGHDLAVSCGAALELAQLGLASAGCTSVVQLTPDPHSPDLLARLTVTGFVAADEDTGRRVEAARRRYSDRRPFAPRPVPEDTLDLLTAAAGGENVSVHMVQRADERLGLAVVASRADRTMQSDPAYREELARWIRKGPADDGVPVTAVPHIVDPEPRHTEVPMRDFEAGVTGTLPVRAGQDEDPVLAVVMTDDDGTDGCLRAGAALARLLVEAQAQGLATSISSQPFDWPVLRERMRQLMSWNQHAQI
ncbi:MAG: nitroreductase, partial [Actinomycetota bacterium]|nr:nitroreductase [Actinomycetota bacterium]